LNKMFAGFTLLKIMVLTKKRPPTPIRHFQLKSRLNLFLILNLSIENTIL
jgi:hypothetical protein